MHDVTIEGETKRMYANEIIDLFKKYEEEVPEHFSYLMDKSKESLDSNESYSEDDEIYISDLCRLSYPCQHSVTYRGETRLMGGRKIVELFRSLDRPVPEHFHYLLEEERINNIRKHVKENDMEFVRQQQDEDLQKCIESACERSNLEMVKYLLQHGAELKKNCYIKVGSNPNQVVWLFVLEHCEDLPVNLLKNASKSGNTDLVRYLLEDRDMEIEPSVVGSCSGDLRDYLMEQCVKQGRKIGQRTFIGLVKDGDMDSVSFILDNGLLENQNYVIRLALRERGIDEEFVHMFRKMLPRIDN